MSWQDILSQTRALTVLKGIVATKRIANSYLFIGPKAAGKTMAVQEFARAINCLDYQDQACGQCANCQLFKKENNPDYYRLVYENSIKIEQIRELNQQVQHGPYQAKYLIVLIEGAENLTREAENSFLKLLEEPPAQVVFILETSNKSSLLPTIISRCQLIVFNQLTDQAMLTILGKKYPAVSPEQLEKAVKLSGNLLPIAENLIANQEENKEIFSFFRDLKNKRLSEIFAQAEKLAQQNKEELLQKLQTIAQFLKNENDLARAKILVTSFKYFKNNVNLRQTLEVMMIKMKDLIYSYA